MLVAAFAVLACVATPMPVAAQGATAAPQFDVSAAVNLNTKGISQVPALTLGRPSAIFDLAVRRGEASFEPQFRFATDGTPWSFLLWGRYRAVSTGRFRLTVGGHPAFSFRTTTVQTATTPRELIEVRRYLAGEGTPTYTLTTKLSIGAYYLYSHGFDGASPHTNLVAARLNASNLAVFRGTVLQVQPQVYFLRTSGQQGQYLSASAALTKPGAPLSITAIVNQPLRTRVVGGQKFLWNVGVSYLFR